MGNIKISDTGSAIRAYIDQDCSSDTLLPKQAKCTEVELLVKNIIAFQAEHTPRQS